MANKYVYHVHITLHGWQYGAANCILYGTAALIGLKIGQILVG